MILGRAWDGLRVISRDDDGFGVSLLLRDEIMAGHDVIELEDEFFEDVIVVGTESRIEDVLLEFLQSGLGAHGDLVGVGDFRELHATDVFDEAFLGTEDDLARLVGDSLAVFDFF
jgi:hypothetical protein